MKKSCERHFLRRLRNVWGAGRASAALALCLLPFGCNSAPGTTQGTTQSLTAKDGSTGVSVCDSYLDQYEVCAQSVFASQPFKQHLKGIQKQRATWAALADSQPKRDALALLCKRAIVTARAEFPSCTFAGG